MENSENEPLLINRKTTESEQEEKQGLTNSRTFPIYLFSLIIVIFSCAQDLQSKVVTLYMYDILGGNQNHSASVTNTSGSTGSCFSNNSSVSENTLQSSVSQWSWYFSILENGITFFVIIIVGIYSDVIGRKPFVILSLIGTGIKFGATAFFVFIRSDVWFLFIVYAIGGISGSNNVFGLCCLALIADVTKRSNARTMGFAVFDVLLGIGLSGTEIAGGYLVQLTGYIWPCVIASVLCVLCSITFVLFIPEKLQETDKQNFGLCNSLVDLFKFYFSDKHFYDNKIWIFNLAMGIFIIIWLMFGGFNSALYELGEPFCWKPEDIGRFNSATILIHLIIGVVLIKVLHTCLRDEHIACIGCVSAMAYMLLFGLANSGWMLYVATATGIMSVMPLPILRAIMSRMVKEDKQGALFANISIIEVICMLCSSSIFNNIYAATQNFMRGFAFLVMAGFFLISSVLFIPLIITNRRRQNEELVIQS